MDPQIVWQCPLPWMLDMSSSDWAAWAQAAAAIATLTFTIYLQIQNRRLQQREIERAEAERQRLREEEAAKQKRALDISARQQSFALARLFELQWRNCCRIHEYLGDHRPEQPYESPHEIIDLMKIEEAAVDIDAFGDEVAEQFHKYMAEARQFNADLRPNENFAGIFDEPRTNPRVNAAREGARATIQRLWNLSAGLYEKIREWQSIAPDVTRTPRA